MISDTSGERTMRIRVRAILLALAMSTIPTAQGATDQAEVLASNGQIDDHAAVKASSEIFIAAPTDKVWNLLVGIDAWPKWHPNISAANITGPVKEGTEFKWTTGGTKIASRLALVKPDEELAWTGTALHVTAIHVWQLRAAPNGGTLVSTKESMHGFMLKLFYSSADLQKTQRAWLDALKREAQR